MAWSCRAILTDTQAVSCTDTCLFPSELRRLRIFWVVFSTILWGSTNTRAFDAVAVSHYQGIGSEAIRLVMGQSRRRKQRTRVGRELLEDRRVLAGFTAYNSIETPPNPNVTQYADFGGSGESGLLRDVATGLETAVRLTTRSSGVNFGGQGTNPRAGTDAASIFDGFVDFSTGARRSVEIEAGDSIRYEFSGLSSGATYAFAGSAVRGNASYTDRWTLVELVGADGFRADHSDGLGVITTGLPSNQVAFWSGNNVDDGHVVQWLDISPGADGRFEVISTQYRGAVPTQIHGGGTASGSKGYGLSAIRLVEDEPAGPPQVANTSVTDIRAFVATLGGRLLATGGQVPDVRLYYGTRDGGTNAAGWQHVVDLNDVRGDFTATIENLSPSTQYFYRAFAETSLGSDWADAASSFTTLSATAPSIVLLPPSTIGATSAILGGTVTDTGNDTTTVELFYGDNNGGSNPTAWDHSIPLGMRDADFRATLTGLEPGTEYFVAARATNRVGSTWSSAAQRFQTRAEPSGLEALTIREFAASTSSGVPTRIRLAADGAYQGINITPDWIEIHNGSGDAVDLGGMWLSDDAEDPRKWQFPDGTLLAPDGYLVVYASGLDITDVRLDQAGRLHTNFGLDASGGEDLGLFDDDGNPLSLIEDYPPQFENVSYGIDTSGQPRYYGTATPGAANDDATPTAPEFSEPSRTFSGQLSVTLSAADPTATIYYTLDGRVPTTTSTRYRTPLTITTSTEVRAIAIAANGRRSLVNSQSYVKLASSVVDRSSHLPIVVVETFGGNPDSTDAFIGLIEPGDDNATLPGDAFSLQTRGHIAVRGRSSQGFPKKQYRVSFEDEAGRDRDLQVLEMPGEADWILYGPGVFERALMTNPLIYELSNQIGRYAVRTRWVEMYLNANGGDVTSSDFVGLYAVMETIDIGGDRIDVGMPASGAYGLSNEGAFIWENGGSSVYKDLAQGTSRTYVDQYMRNFERATLGTNFKDPVAGYAAHIDVGSFVDHNLLNLLAMNVDALRLSSYYVKPYEGLLEAGPIWDFDRSFNSNDGRTNNPAAWNGTGDSTRYFDDSSRVGSWWPRLFQDPDFVQQYIDRWFELRQTQFSLENLFATIDRHAEQIGAAANRDFARWNWSGSFSSNVSSLKQWITRRVQWIDSQWLAPPVPSVTGAAVEAGTAVQLSTPVGQVYYTLDGSDPRGEDGAIRPEAIRASGPIVVNGLMRITARVYRANHGPSNQGYIASGDDWSPPLRQTYFTTPPANAQTLAITEVNYHPHDPTPAEIAAGFDAASDFEFIELQNITDETISLIGTRFQQVEIAGETQGVAFDFLTSPLAELESGQRIVIVENADAFALRYGNQIPIAGQWSGGLNNASELLTLIGYDDQVIRQFAYRDDGAWPGRADGNGSTLEIIDPSASGQEAVHWRSSIDYGGSPGSAGRTSTAAVVINEVLANSAAPSVDTIELANAGATDVDLGGWYLSDSNQNYFKYQIPQGTVLPAGGYLVLEEQHFANENLPPGQGFLLSSFGDDLTLVGQDTRGLFFVDRVEFGASMANVSLGRLPDRTEGNGLVPLATTSFGTANVAHRVGELIVSEIQYNPPGPDAGLEFLELSNHTSAPLELSQWRINRAVDYRFPSYSLDPGAAVLVVGFDPANATELARFRQTYGISSQVAIFGPWETGDVLDDGGERIDVERLSDEQPPGSDSPEFVLIDQVRYDDVAPWPTSADAQGDSLQRIRPSAYGNDASSWRAALPTPGRTSFVSDGAGDLNGDGRVDVQDVDLICAAIASEEGDYDLNQDGATDDRDVDVLVESLLGTSAGDVNLDGRFDSTDLVLVFQAGIYEDLIPQNARWSTGDWNCDGEFNSSDLVRAFQTGRYFAG